VEALQGLAPTGARPGAARRRWRLSLLLVPAALLTVVLGAGAGHLWMTTPAGDDLPARVATITADSGTVPLRPAEVPTVLAQAVVAVEDERFYAHHGLDTLGTARAVLDDVSRGCACEGGSTVTQQLAKLVYYPNDGRLARKLPGIAVAFKLEIHYDKAQIMAAYLSVVPMGYGLVGAGEATCALFGHDLSRLTVPEAAELGGSAQAPSAHGPRHPPDGARARRDYALERKKKKE